MNKDYYYTEQEWNKSIGYGHVPYNRQEIKVDESPSPGEQRLNSLGELERYHEGTWQKV